MKSLIFAAIACLSLTGVVHASGPIAVYALVDKVVQEGDTIRLSGVFMTAQGQTDVYSTPQRGYLYLGLPAGKEEQVRREWADLKSVAGSRQVVGIGSSWYSKVRVRKSDEEAKSTDDYPIGNGLVKVNSDHPKAKALLDSKDR